MTTVRPATERDLEQLLPQLAAMKAEAPEFAGQTFSEARAAVTAGRAIAGGGVWVGEVGGTVHGFLMAELFPQDWFEGNGVYEQALYVVPRHRGGFLATRLIRAVEAWGLAQPDVRAMFAGSSTGVATGKVVRLYECLGWRRAQVGLVKEFRRPP